jgi:hypothetical protein
MQRDDILGAWLLASYTADAAGEVSQPLGPDPQGIIMYTADGYMSAQLMRRDRPAYDRAITGGGTTEQMAAAASGYLCYSGPYRLDEAAEVLHHHVQVSLLPNWIGGIQVRNAKLAAGTLTLSAVVTSRKGASSSHVLVWRRPTPG